MIGCGTIGRIHAQAFMSLDSANLLSLNDENYLVAQSAAESLGLATTVLEKDLGAILRNPEIGLVSICVPTGSHLEIASKALRAGKNVIIEKPIDVDLERAREFLKLLSQARDTSAYVISQHRYDPASVELKRLVAEGALGKLTSATASVSWWRSQDYYNSAAWRGTWKEDGGGALMNQGIHTLDLLLWMMGSPVEVFAYAKTLSHSNIEVEDTLVATIRFESGALATVHATTSAYPGIEASIQVMGTQGSCKITNDLLTYSHISSPEHPVGDFGLNGKGNQLSISPEGSYADASANYEPHARQLNSVVEAISKGGIAQVSAEEAFLALATTRAIYASAQLGTPVKVTSVLEGEYDTLKIDFGKAD